ncbi:MAG TPA: SRPBCC family protein [Terriglobales bacterium]|nr:SRPBCC family protein [Terriglobales bacterium]
MLYHFHSEHWIAVPLNRVFEFFANPENLPRISPPKQDARIEELRLVSPPRHPLGLRATGFAGIGSEMVMSFRASRLLPRRIRWRARIVDFEWDRYFIDAQVKGPMEFWTHRHGFERSERDGTEGTLIRDDIEYGPGFGMLGGVADALVIRHSLRNMFDYRREAVERLLPPARKTDLPPQIADRLQKVGEQLKRLSTK